MFEKKRYISANLRISFALALLTLSFFFWPFFCWFFLFLHFLYFLLLFHKSNFYVLVIVSVVWGFLGFVMCYLLDLLFCFWGHLTWP